MKSPTNCGERARRLQDFAQKFEALAGILCQASHYVPSSEADEQYRSISLDVRQCYGSVCAYLRCFMKTRGLDPVLALTHADSMDEWLLLDDGNMIGYIEDVQEAVRLYGQHLQVLGKKHEKNVSER